MKTADIHAHSALRKILSVLLLAALLSGLMAAASAQTAYAASDELSAADLYEKNVNSTVGITISAKTTSRYGYGYTYQASGSGFIISEDGYILTNYHVISGYDTVTVATYEDETFDAAVIGYDENNDIAVLKIDADSLRPVTLGDSDTLRVGDPVYAIGNPLGELTFSLTGGIVSALSRNVRTGSGTSLGLIQTDCAINSGNSGGALFNTRGEVIGITNAKYSASGFSGEAEIDNIGFAIPINSVKKIISSIIENGYVERPYIGVTVSPISEETAAITGIKSGAVVQEVAEGSPAEEAGIQKNDVIVKVDSKTIHDTADLVQVVAAADPGSKLNFHIYRQGEELTLKVEVGSKTESALKNEEAAAAAEEEAQNAEPQMPDGQNVPQEQEGMPDWSGTPFEDFFRYFFGS